MTETRQTYAATPKEIWGAALDSMRGSTTKAAFDAYLSRLKLIRIEENTYTITAPTPEIEDWIKNRLHTLIQRALASVTQNKNIALKFIVAQQPSPARNQTSPPADEQTSPQEGGNEGGPNSQPPTPTVPILSDLAKAYPPPEETSGLNGIDYNKLWFKKSGYTAVPDYFTQFWQAYLNTLNRKAYSIWLTIASYDKRNTSAANFNDWWTPPKRFGLKELARIVGGGYQTLTGRLLFCQASLKAIEDGEPLKKCCGRKNPNRWVEITTKAGATANACQYWYPGALEILYRENLIGVEITKNKHPRAHRMRLQVWRMLPLLTPHQVERLSQVHQIRHEQWINRYSDQAGFSMADWEQITERRLVKTLPGFNQKTLRLPYQPNPLAQTEKQTETGLW